MNIFLLKKTEKGFDFAFQHRPMMDEMINKYAGSNSAAIQFVENPKHNITILFIGMPRIARIYLKMLFQEKFQDIEQFDFSYIINSLKIDMIEYLEKIHQLRKNEKNHTIGFDGEIIIIVDNKAYHITSIMLIREINEYHDEFVPQGIIDNYDTKNGSLLNLLDDLVKVYDIHKQKENIFKIYGNTNDDYWSMSFFDGSVKKIRKEEFIWDLY